MEFTHIVGVQSIIANYFDQNPEKTSVTYKTISLCKTKIESAFRELGRSVYVQFMRDDIINMLNNNPYLFDKDWDKGIIKLKSRKRLDKELPYFSAIIDHTIKEKCLELFQNFKGIEA